MDIDDFFEPRVLIVSGKGGVGKTTVAAALAVLAARQDRTVCVAEVDQKGTLPNLFGGGSLGYTPTEIAPRVWGMNISPDQALAEYLDVQYHMKRIARVFTSTHFVDYVTTAAPGLKDILVLGKVWYLEQGRGDRALPRFDTIIVDAPAAGHMLTFLQAPMALADAIRVGPVRRQADWLAQMLKDPDRTRVHLVTLPEEMPVSETIETAAALAERIEIAQGLVFANAVYPDRFTAKQRSLLSDQENLPVKAMRAEAEAVGLKLDEEDFDSLAMYARFLNARRKIQTTHLTKLDRATDQPVVQLPYLFTAGVALPQIEVLADVMSTAIKEMPR